MPRRWVLPRHWNAFRFDRSNASLAYGFLEGRDFLLITQIGAMEKTISHAVQIRKEMTVSITQAQMPGEGPLPCPSR